MSGWIKLHRKILNDEFFMSLTSKQKTVIITALLLANSEDRRLMIKGEIVELSRGEFVTSLSSLQRYCGHDLSIGSIRNTLKKAEDYGFIQIDKRKNHTIIRICNWCKFQDNSVDKPVKSVDKKVMKNENKQAIPSDSEAFSLANLLWDYMLKNNPNAKEPNFQKWAEDMDKIIRIDKREVETIKKVIVYSQTNDFWHKNILSPSKLRKQFDKLYLQLPKEKREAKREVTGGTSDGWSYI